MRIMLIITVLVFVLSCSKKGDSYYNEKSAPVSEQQDQAIDIQKIQVAASENTSAGQSKLPDQPERKQIKNGNIDFHVDNLPKAEKSVTALVKSQNGYIQSSEYASGSLRMIVKIPATGFDQFFEQSGNFGKVMSKQISTEDVTMQFYDLESRIKTKRILLNRLQEYLTRAKNIDEIVKLESEINRVTQEVESIEGQFKNMSHLISYSTISLDFYVPGTESYRRSISPFYSRLTDVWYDVADFCIDMFFNLLYTILYGVPVLIFISIIYFILFAKKGLVRIIWRWIKK